MLRLRYFQQKKLPFNSPRSGSPFPDAQADERLTTTRCRRISIIRSLCCLLLLFSPSLAVGLDTSSAHISNDTLPQCNALLRACFGVTNLDRANCFYSSATHPFCDSSSLGKLALKRWQMAPNRPNGTSDAHGFLGPQRVNLSCLKTFDESLSEQLLNASLTEALLKQLDEQIETCYDTLPIELVRP